MAKTISIPFSTSWSVTSQDTGTAGVTSATTSSVTIAVSAWAWSNTNNATASAYNMTLPSRCTSIRLSGGTSGVTDKFTAYYSVSLYGYDSTGAGTLLGSCSQGSVKYDTSWSISASNTQKYVRLGIVCSMGNYNPDESTNHTYYFVLNSFTGVKAFPTLHGYGHEITGIYAYGHEVTDVKAYGHDLT